VYINKLGRVRRGRFTSETKLISCDCEQKLDKCFDTNKLDTVLEIIFNIHGFVKNKNEILWFLSKIFEDELYRLL